MQNVLVKRLMLSCLLAVSLTGAIWATDFKVDPTHSSVGFSIKHMFTNVTGQFSQFNGRFSHNQKTKKLHKAGVFAPAFLLRKKKRK